jgi:integrase-like protein
LVEMIPYAKVNKGYRYILVVINAFSKYVWAFPVKRKTGKAVSETMEKVLSSLKTTPKNLQTDMGKEFYNKEFQNLMKKFNVNHYSSFSNLKSSIVERCNRTLKNMMWKQFSLQGTYKWLDLLRTIVKRYNSRKHRTTGFKPEDVNSRNANEILKNAYSHTKTVDPKKQKFQVGQHVRISKHRAEFTKGYTPAWSNEIFKIEKVRLTNPTTYILEDVGGQEIKGGFYEYELQKTKHSDVYLVEKVIKRRGNEVLVKWLGLDKKHNSWISKNNVL